MDTSGNKTLWAFLKLISAMAWLYKLVRLQSTEYQNFSLGQDHHFVKAHIKSHTHCIIQYTKFGETKTKYLHY